jgi:hypothetical protein
MGVMTVMEQTGSSVHERGVDVRGGSKTDENDTDKAKARDKEEGVVNSQVTQYEDGLSTAFGNLGGIVTGLSYCDMLTLF